MPLWVKVENGEVTQCWDTEPPEGEAGWRPAIEVKPELTPKREVYGQHYFNVEAVPVQIIWPVEPWLVEDRKWALRSWAQSEFQQVVANQTRNELNSDPTTEYDPLAVDAARVLYRDRLAAIDAAQTHEDLDAVS